jgi:hypothetical protein
MFEKLINANEVVRELNNNTEDPALFKNIPEPLFELMQECGGCSFWGGLYRIHSTTSSVHWAIIIENYYPTYLGKIIPFGYDWMGRQFCNYKGEPNLILMFDPATVEDYKLERNVIDFHNIDLVDNRESMLSDLLFKQVKHFLKIEKVAYQECIGYRVPLFLNGMDEFPNQEIIDMEVYWETQCQLYKQIKDLPEGTKIGSIKFTERK